MDKITSSVKVLKICHQKADTKSDDKFNSKTDKKIPLNEDWTIEQQILLESGYIRAKNGELISWKPCTK